MSAKVAGGWLPRLRHRFEPGQVRWRESKEDRAVSEEYTLSFTRSPETATDTSENQKEHSEPTNRKSPMFSLRCGRRSVVPAMATTHPGGSALTLPRAPGSLQAPTEHVPLRVFNLPFCH